jgi:phytoene dehydrogenase-like protein
VSDPSWDAIVVGSGPNGLVAANRLVDAGWSVLVVEAQPDLGGAVRSARDVHPDYVHDTFSSFYPLAAASPTISSLGLERYGLRWSHAPAVLGHPLPDGSWALQHRDRETTAEWLDADSPGDGEHWLDLCDRWDHIGDAVVQSLLTPMPPVRGGLKAISSLRGAGGLELVRLMLSPALDLGQLLFTGRAAPLLLAGNAGHADIPITAPGSGLFGLLLSMLGQTVGYPVPEGGAGRLAHALADRFRDRGGEVRCGSEVLTVDVRAGRAVGVRLVDGERLAATRAVVADVTAPQLYVGLLHPADAPARKLAALRRFQFDPSTVKVDWAMSGPVPWASAPAAAPGTVHVADGVDEIAVTQAQLSAGVVPDRPFLLVGQMTTADPTRSPDGTEALWAYTHVPQATRADAGGELSGRWDAAELERFADRMQARLERLAPGFSTRILDRRVLGPHELEARNANLVGGAVNGGTAQLQQQLVFRPVAGLGRAETGVKGLYLGSSSAHPGGGVHGACGDNAARAALAHDRLRLRRHRG